LEVLGLRRRGKPCGATARRVIADVYSQISASAIDSPSLIVPLFAQIEELSNQNEDLIQKLKESMERELELR
jgi:hypothetical protein